jgi:hypothetical protein
MGLFIKETTIVNFVERYLVMMQSEEKERSTLRSYDLRRKRKIKITTRLNGTSLWNKMKHEDVRHTQNGCLPLLLMEM